MNNPDYNYDHPWDDSVYGTGNTEPPKSRNGLVALLLILVIFLCGIIALLGILNVKLFTQLSLQQKEENISLAIMDETAPAEEISPVVTEPLATAHEEVSGADTSIALNTTPQSVENIPQEGGMSLQDIYDKNIPSVVSITSSSHSGSSTGTGVVLTENGYIVTNAHVVSGGNVISVQLTDDRVFQAELIGSDEISDLAVLRIEAMELTAAEFGDSTQMRVGDAVCAIGDPLGAEFRGTYTDGIVSAINRDMDVDGRTMTLIQTNAALNSGNSGGPLINCYGQVIGINTMKIGTFTDKAGVEGLGFAIPSATVKEIVDQLIRQGYVSGRPTLGIEGEMLSTFYQYYYRLPAGLYISRVEEGSYSLTPKAFISYKRVAYAGKTDPDLRITFDRQITSRYDDVRLESLKEGHEVLPEKTYLMEIKIPGAMPLWLAHVLSEKNIFPHSFSKFGTAHIQQKIKLASGF